MRPIEDVARSVGIPPSAVEPHGRWIGKIALEAESAQPSGRLILVSAMTPTPAGEGKTTCSIGIAQGLSLQGVRAAVALRQASLGPYLGMKGGGSGGGASRLEPQDAVNLHFTGDIHAVTSAHNLLAAIIDNHLQQGNALGLDPRRITWRRVLDMNDRSLRDIIVGLGGAREGVPRETGFDITAASEVMAILCLARNIADLKARLARMVIGWRQDGSVVQAGELNVTGAMAALLAEAMKPNLAQTGEGVAAFVHGGPFANIAHGTSSVVATRLALAHAEAVVTEAGFAFDLGGEKFVHIACAAGGFAPSCVVIVATLRALRLHGGASLARVAESNPAAVAAGFENLEKHLENAWRLGIPPIVCLNQFPGDTPEEFAEVKSRCAAIGVEAVVAQPFTHGGEGCRDIAAAAWALASQDKAHLRPVYETEEPIERKISAVAMTIYGAEGADLQPKALREAAALAKAGHDRLPICMAKTHLSLSDDPKKLGRPKAFRVTVREIQLAAGAGYLVPITGDIVRMPGMPATPLAEKLELMDNGEVVAP